MNEHYSMIKRVVGLGKSILGRQKSMNRPSMEKIKEGQYSWSTESKRKGGIGWGCRGDEEGQNNKQLSSVSSDFISRQ